MKVVHVAFECAPVYKTGGLGDVAGSLPIALEKEGTETVVVLPGYHWIKRLDYLPHSNVKIIYIEDPLFHTGLKTHDPRLTAKAYAHFCRGVIQLLYQNSIKPDIIHCHDWHTGLIPAFLKLTQDPTMLRIKTLLTIHNIGYQGTFPTAFLKGQNIPLLDQLLSKKTKISYLKEGMRYADFISTVSPHHAEEIRKGNAAFGLKELIAKKRGRFVGILNGIDTGIWDPSRDKLIAESYTSVTRRIAKPKNKLLLQKELGIEINKTIPLFGFVARLSSQKGIDLLLPLLDRVPRKRIQIVILGTGEKVYETLLSKYQKQLDRGWYNVILKFDERLAHRIYAGSDFFLIPSHYEPCGLTQMISMRYGSIPIVTMVGGLVDTVKDGKTGIYIKDLSAEGVVRSVEKATTLWEDRFAYETMQAQVMRQNFSWEKSAREYSRLYKRMFTK